VSPAYTVSWNHNFNERNSQGTDSSLAPAEAAVEYETVVFHNNFHEDRTPYQGPPNDEVDRKWEELYHGKLCAFSPLRVTLNMQFRYWHYSDR
jgi:hypothetical protein